MARKPRVVVPALSGARICPGFRVQIIKGQFKGEFAQAMVLSQSMWLVQLDSGRRVNLHRSVLKRVDQTVAA